MKRANSTTHRAYSTITVPFRQVANLPILEGVLCILESEAVNLYTAYAAKALSTAALPPQISATGCVYAPTSTAPLCSAAITAAPAGSTSWLHSAHSQRMAATICASLTVTI